MATIDETFLLLVNQNTPCTVHYVIMYVLVIKNTERDSLNINNINGLKGGSTKVIYMILCSVSDGGSQRLS